MPCYFPIFVQRGDKITDLIRGRKTEVDVVPCGKCVGCIKQVALSWAVRCYHESKLHEKNCFVTLTYDEDHKPSDGSVRKSVLQDFMQKIRDKYGNGIRFYGVGEYGDLRDRPHYHVLLFNHQFPDLKLWQLKNNQLLYRSQELEKIWDKGYSTVGGVSMETAMYAALYAQKKLTGAEAEKEYKTKEPEFALMSRNPGLGHEYIKRFPNNFYPKGFEVIGGQRYRPPRYYDDHVGRKFPKLYSEVKAKRKKDGKENDPGPERKYQISEVKKVHKEKLQRRSYETEPVCRPGQKS